MVDPAHDRRVLRVAVTGAAGVLGRAVLRRLDTDPAVRCVLGIARTTPPLPPATLELVHADLRDPVLATALHGVDTLVHLDVADRLSQLGRSGPPPPAETAATRVLRAVERAGVRAVVHVSTALAYGATETNAVPLSEQAPLRADASFPAAHEAARVEAVVRRFAAEHDDVRVVILRPVSLLGPQVDSLVTRHLESPVLPLVSQHDPPVQFVGIDDLATAVALVAVDPRADGPYNVAADGWLTTSDVRALLARPTVHVPHRVAVRAATAAHRAGVLSEPPGALAYLMHPWVVDTARLRALGWRAQQSHRDLLHAFVDDHHGWISVGRLRVRISRVLAALGGATALAAALVITGMAVAARRWRGRPR